MFVVEVWSPDFVRCTGMLVVGGCVGEDLCVALVEGFVVVGAGVGLLVHLGISASAVE